MLQDISTICAIATSGTGAISVVRVSGPDTYRIVDRIFAPANKSLKLLDAEPNTIHYGTIAEGETLIDEVLVTLFKAPQSYTGEDVIEISCHGSSYIQKKILEMLINYGAVAAKAGEFTQRAFLNGKMDLSQAEAVADLIASESQASHDMAMQQMRGGFSKNIKELRASLLKFISLVELELDFTEEDVEFADREALSLLVSEVRELVDKLKNSFQLGNVIKSGVPVAIIGKPNVGKSTLLNALLNEDRAIVSEIEGTTRDSIEDTVVIEGITFRFIDTAGIRETADRIENLGIRRTYKKMEQASIIMLLADASDNLTIIQQSLAAIREQLQGNRRKTKDKSSSPSPPLREQSAVDRRQLVLVLNKSDQIEKKKVKEIEAGITLMENEYFISISAERQENIHELTDLLFEIVNIGTIKHQDVVISNIRHFNALKAASDSLERVSEGLSSALPQDLLAQDIRETLHHLGEITGEVTTDEILGNIFKNFCIGK